MTHDFVIVGAGSAGCVLANRLSSDSANRVLLIEAGDWDRNAWLHIPMGFGRTFGDPNLTWNDVGAPGVGIDGRSMALPYGKVIGGSSSVNGLLYIRGQREDYDHWRELGNPGWGYDDVLPLFRRAEDHLAGADAWHGTDGPLGVSRQRPHPIADAFIAAGRGLQLSENADFNGARQEGVGYYETTTRGGRRCSAAAAYLKPVRRRKNLTILTAAMARRVKIEGGRAVGVEYDRDGQRHVATALREVILCGGAIASPHLLQLSGIGPGAALKAVGISPLVDAPEVGRNLQDHARVATVFRARGAITFNDEYNRLWRRARMGLTYALLRRGPLTGGAGLAGGFLKSRSELGTPDLQVILQLFSWEGRGQRLHRFSGFATQVADLRPESRGWVTVRSPDAAERPLVVPNYLASVTDALKLVRALKLLRQFAETEPLSRFIREEHTPGPVVESDADLLAYVRATAVTTFHMAGTCRMGADDHAVVDPALRVRGVVGLRVADASIMPRLVAGNTNAPVIMIGEKAAELILND